MNDTTSEDDVVYADRKRKDSSTTLVDADHRFYHRSDEVQGDDEALSNVAGNQDDEVDSYVLLNLIIIHVYHHSIVPINR